MGQLFFFVRARGIAGSKGPKGYSPGTSKVRCLQMACLQKEKLACPAVLIFYSMQAADKRQNNIWRNKK